MKVLVMNCGSSSLKYQLLDMQNRSVLASGIVERIGIAGGFLTHKPVGKEKVVVEQDMKNHAVAVELVLEKLVDPVCGVISDMKEIDAVGHRVLHAGDKFSESIVVDDKVIDAIKECIPLGPLHNPANLIGIEACTQALPGVKQVAVFDTAFGQTMPAEAYMYAIPYEYYEKYSVRKYGFHGTSHKYIAQRTAQILNDTNNELKMIICHLGNGSSITAVKDGKCIETSMGLTPLDGLVMGTRSGTIDPAVVKFLADNENLTIDEIDTILNKKSGVLGISGLSSDFRDLEAAEATNERAKLALDMFYYRVRAVIGSYVAALDGVDVIIFTAGVGENSGYSRKRILEKLTYLGINVDDEANTKRGEEIVISTPESKVKVMVVPTNEELMIAIDTERLVK